MYTHSVLDVESVLQLFGLQKMQLGSKEYYVSDAVLKYVKKIKNLMDGSGQTPDLAAQLFAQFALSQQEL
ncbi:MAG: hypothetical protein Q4B28_03255 [bacterium]|nr:hypothetical protein [bacterium]